MRYTWLPKRGYEIHTIAREGIWLFCFTMKEYEFIPGSNQPISTWDSIEVQGDITYNTTMGEWDMAYTYIWYIPWESLNETNSYPTKPKAEWYMRWHHWIQLCIDDCWMWNCFILFHWRMDRQMDWRYQVHYLSASLSYAVDNNLY